MHPERVMSLVVASSIGGVQDPEYLEVQHRLRPPEIQGLPVELKELGPSYRALNPEGTLQWTDIERSSRPEGTSGPGQPLRESMTFARLDTMRVPVLVLVGHADLLSPPALMRLLATHIPPVRVCDGTRSGPRGLLGAAGYVEPLGAEIHRQAYGLTRGHPVRWS